MMKKILLLVVALLGLTGFSLVGSSIEDDVTEIRKAFQDFTKSAVLAVPGERYLQLLERTHSKDLKEKAEAQDQVRRMFNVDPDSEYIATVWFDYDSQNGPLRAAIRPGALNMSEAAAKLLTAAGEGLTFSQVGTTPSPLLTDKERDDLIDERLALALEKLAGKPYPDGNSSRLRYIGGGLQPEDVNSCPKTTVRVKPGQGLAKRIRDCRHSAVDSLRMAILAGYQSSPLPKESQTLTVRWHPLKHAYLYVFIPENDLKRHLEKKLRVWAVVHKKGDPNATLHDMTRVALNPHYMKRNAMYPRLIDGATDELIAWTAERLDSNLPAANQLIEARDELDRILSAIETKARRK